MPSIWPWQVGIGICGFLIFFCSVGGALPLEGAWCTSSVWNSLRTSLCAAGLGKANEGDPAYGETVDDPSVAFGSDTIESVVSVSGALWQPGGALFEALMDNAAAPDLTLASDCIEGVVLTALWAQVAEFRELYDFVSTYHLTSSLLKLVEVVTHKDAATNTGIRGRLESRQALSVVCAGATPLIGLGRQGRTTASLWSALLSLHDHAKRELSVLQDMRGRNTLKEEDGRENRSIICVQFKQLSPSSKEAQRILHSVATAELFRTSSSSLLVCFSSSAEVPKQYFVSSAAQCECSVRLKTISGPQQVAILSPLDGFELLPLSAPRLHSVLSDALGVLRAGVAGVVSLRHKVVDTLGSSDALRAVLGGSFGSVERYWAGMQLVWSFGGSHFDLSLPELYESLMLPSLSSEPKSTYCSRWGESTLLLCPFSYTPLHFSDLGTINDVFLMSGDTQEWSTVYDSLAVSQGAFVSINDNQGNALASLPHPVALYPVSACASPAEVYIVPVDFWAPCREHVSWLVVDFLQAVQTLLSVASALAGITDARRQGCCSEPRVVMVEPEFAHMVDDRRWQDLPDNSDWSIETWRSVCRPNPRNEFVPFRNMFDIDWFSRDIARYGVHGTIPFSSFSAAGESGRIDVLFLIEAAPLPGGLVDDLDTPDGPFLACADYGLHDTVSIFGHPVYVGEVRCVGHDKIVDFEKLNTGLKSAVFESTKQRVSIGLYLYGHVGLERHRMQLSIPMLSPLLTGPSLWSALRLNKAVWRAAQRYAAAAMAVKCSRSKQSDDEYS